MRRFIAGAVCPSCRAVDRIVVEEVEGERQRRCVRCGYTDHQLESAAVREPTTRLDSRGRDDTPNAAVRILMPEGTQDGKPES